MRILVLEDDSHLGPWVTNGLREEGHIVDLFDDGKDALIAATTHEFDLFIFDRMVPGIDGLSLLKSLRAAKNTTPAIFLTALGDVDDRVDGLKAGGDDYMVKPFAFAELSARVDAIARRPKVSNRTDTKLSAGDITLDIATRKVTRKGRNIDLNPKEFQLLEYFMRRPGRVITRTILLEQLWNMSFDPTTSVVETHISRLRSKIDKPFENEVITTKRGAGYVFKG